jgi:O-antigen/teichoic acid export membrane protein
LYAAALGAQFAIALLLIALAAATGKTGWLWREQRLDQIVLVTLLDWLVFLALSLQQLGDSKGITAYQQLVGVAVALLSLLGLLALKLTQSLNFYSFVWLSVASATVNCVLLVSRLMVRHRAVFWSGTLAFGAYVARWWRFTRPLLLLQYYMPLVAYLGPYLIQKWYGSEQQGYYALAMQWCGFAMLFTNSGVWIFWREIAHHTSARDMTVAAGIYRQFNKLFFFLALVLAFWLSASSGLLVDVVAGQRFQAAEPVLQIMAFYPISQTLGQLTMVSLKAMEHTGSYARWSAFLSIPDLALTYFVLAPADAAVPGLHLGAVGLAAKTALYGFLSVQAYDWLNCHYLGIRYLGSLLQRLLVVMVVGITAVVLFGIGAPILHHSGLGELGTLGIASFAYLLAVALLLLAVPDLAGLTRARLHRGLAMLRLG